MKVKETPLHENSANINSNNVYSERGEFRQFKTISNAQKIRKNLNSLIFRNYQILENVEMLELMKILTKKTEVLKNSTIADHMKIYENFEKKTVIHSRECI